MRNRGRGVQAAAAALAATGVILAVSEAGAQQSGNEFPVGVDDTALRFDPTEITVSVNDTVVWDFDGSTTAHNVVTENDVAADPEWAKFATAPASSGQFKYKFTAVGEYTYVCDLHRVQGMTGKVTVIAAPVATPERTPRPDKTPTPLPNVTATPDHSRDTPAPTSRAGADKAAPVVSKLSAKKAGATGARVKWTLSEGSALTVKFWRGKSAVRSVRLYGGPGISAVTVRGGALKRGKYTVSVEARDAAGNRSVTQSTSVRIGR